MARPILQRSVELVEQSPLSEVNKQLTLRFKDECLANGLSEKRVSKYLWQLRKFGAWLKIDFDKARLEDIKRVVALIETSPITAWTKCDYKVAVRKFGSVRSQGSDGVGLSQCRQGAAYDLPTLPLGSNHPTQASLRPGLPQVLLSFLPPPLQRAHRYAL